MVKVEGSLSGIDNFLILSSDKRCARVPCQWTNRVEGAKVRFHCALQARVNNLPLSKIYQLDNSTLQMAP